MWSAVLSNSLILPNYTAGDWRRGRWTVDELKTLKRNVKAFKKVYEMKISMWYNSLLSQFYSRQSNYVTWVWICDMYWSFFRVSILKTLGRSSLVAKQKSRRGSTAILPRTSRGLSLLSTGKCSECLMSTTMLVGGAERTKKNCWGQQFWTTAD